MFTLLKVKVSVPVFVIIPPVPEITPPETFTATLLLFTVNSCPNKLSVVKLKVLEGDEVEVIKVPIVAALSKVIIPVSALFPVES